MLLCSVADIRDRVSSALEDDALDALIEGVSDGIEEAVGTWLAPRPDDPDLTTTYLFDVEHRAGSVQLLRGGRLTGIRTLTAIGVATSDQPETGGTYTTVAPAVVLLRPRPGPEGPATRLVLTTGTFHRGFNTLTVTGSFGPAAVSARTREAAIQLVVLALNYAPGLTSKSIGDWSASLVGEGYLRERDAILWTLSGAVWV